jgi:uncharacterized protein YjbJ (UPF0337 family)
VLNQQVLQGNWNEIRGKLREKWGELTNDDVQSFNGNVDQLIGSIQRKTGESRESIETYLGSVSDEFGSTLEKTRAAVQDYASQTRQAAQQQYEQAAEAMRGGYRSAEQMVQSRPAESLATAFGVGLVAGLIIGLVSRR